MKFDRTKFFNEFRIQFGHLNQSQVDGLNTLLAFIEADTDLTDIRWVAYMLATVKLEAARTWQPIDEIGRGAGKQYGIPVTVHCTDGSHTNIYYGRGYVQITWKGRYQAVGHAIGMGDRLMCHPEEVKVPATAYKILSEGMRKGLFTGKKLGDYIHGTTKDYVNARRIVNGLNVAGAIAHDAERMEQVLRDSVLP